MINHAKHPMFPITFLLLIGSIVFLILSTRKRDAANNEGSDDYKREMTNFRMVSIVLGILAIVAVNLVGKN
tara:strand:- start:70 stop:282 length:213 start_codon:yes stop_codon:yes gene_type:complete